MQKEQAFSFIPDFWELELFDFELEEFWSGPDLSQLSQTTWGDIHIAGK